MKNGIRGLLAAFLTALLMCFVILPASAAEDTAAAVVQTADVAAAADGELSLIHI